MFPSCCVCFLSGRDRGRENDMKKMESGLFLRCVGRMVKISRGDKL